MSAFALVARWDADDAVYVAHVRGEAWYSADGSEWHDENGLRVLTHEIGAAHYVGGPRDSKPLCPVCSAPFVVLSGNVTGCAVHGIRSPKPEPVIPPSKPPTLAEELRGICDLPRGEHRLVQRAAAALEAKDKALARIIERWDDTTDGEVRDGSWRGSAAVFHADIEDARRALSSAVEKAGFSISGPTDHRAAEHGEPKWICSARAALAAFVEAGNERDAAKLAVAVRNARAVLAVPEAHAAGAVYAALEQAAAALAVISNRAGETHPGLADADNLASVRGFALEAFHQARVALGQGGGPGGLEGRFLDAMLAEEQAEFAALKARSALGQDGGS